MFQRRRLISGGFIAIALALFLLACNAKEGEPCPPSSCGNIHNISYPFYLKGDPPNCGHRNYLNYELACEDNRTILYLFSGRFYVEDIRYADMTIRVVDPGVHKDNCSSLPLYSLTRYNYSTDATSSKVLATNPYYLVYSYDYIIFSNCENQVISPQYVDTTPCINGFTSSFSSSSLQRHSYAIVAPTWDLELKESCSIDVMVPSSFEKFGNYSFSDIHDELVWGFQLSWSFYSGKYCRPGWYPDLGNNIIFQYINFFIDYCGPCASPLLHVMFVVAIYGIIGIVLILAVRNLCGTLCFFVFLIYKLRRRHLSMYDAIEEFLQGNNNLMPIRYSYSEIKKMTKYFEDKLGQGGFGSVFRGKLRSGRLVAVKMLGSPKGNGQDFINEVLTIGRIHHVNVVQLTGFCVEGSKRALVYEFMPNGSLEKYIFHQEKEGISLSWKKLYEISLGVARGIEYLHRGCDIQILHFDIKPHNILLDQNFTPKVSDFGLAKLYPTDESIVSLTAARGTIGYIAPELFYKNIGGISYKADVYSFGMLLMEMAGRRKNLNAFAEHSSQIYFPSWIYDQFSQGKDDMEMKDATEDEKELAKKMIIVALWCIQLKPIDRPSMSKVIEMLEGSVELLQMPLKPFLCPQEMPIEDHAANANHTKTSSMSCNSIEMITLDVIVD